MKLLTKEDKYKKDFIKDFKEDYPDKFEKIEEALLFYIGENDLRILKTESPDTKWKYLTKKLA